MKVDPQVYDLAAHFMRDVQCASKDETTNELAHCIQQLIEEFLTGLRAVEAEDAD